MNKSNGKKGKKMPMQKQPAGKRYSRLPTKKKGVKGRVAYSSMEAQTE